MKLNVFTRVFGLLTNHFSPPPAEEKPDRNETDIAVMGPNMRRALILKGIRDEQEHPGVRIATENSRRRREARAQK